MIEGLEGFDAGGVVGIRQPIIEQEVADKKGGEKRNEDEPGAGRSGGGRERMIEGRKQGKSGKEEKKNLHDDDGEAPKIGDGDADPTCEQSQLQVGIFG